MKALAILGSRNPEGQTANATRALLSGLQEKGCDTDSVFLPERNIERCRQCENNGWGICREEGHCVIEDDFAEIVDGIAKADIVVFATPVYFSDLSESLRAFTDRLRRTCMHETGKTGVQNKPAVGICVAGGGGGGAPTCAIGLEKVIGRCGFDVVDMIPVRRQNSALKHEVLKTTGKWLADYRKPE